MRFGHLLNQLLRMSPPHATAQFTPLPKSRVCETDAACRYVEHICIWHITRYTVSRHVLYHGSRTIKTYKEHTSQRTNSLASEYGFTNTSEFETSGAGQARHRPAKIIRFIDDSQSAATSLAKKAYKNELPLIVYACRYSVVQQLRTTRQGRPLWHSRGARSSTVLPSRSHHPLSHRVRLSCPHTKLPTNPLQGLPTSRSSPSTNRAQRSLRIVPRPAPRVSTLPRIGGHTLLSLAASVRTMREQVQQVKQRLRH